MATRHDYSHIAPLGSYAARWCPVRIQLDVLQPGEPVPVAPDVQLRMDQGIAFEARTVARLADVAGPGWVFIDETLPGDDCREATVAAIAAGAPAIVGANLPADLEGKRSGKPDMLVLHGDGYVPIDIKHHMTLSPIDKAPDANVSDLAEPIPSATRRHEGWELSARKSDALQLAHYRRMLEALEVSASEQLGGIIGKEDVVVWYHLDEPMWTTPAKSDGRRRKVRTTMEVYDFEFDFRRDISAVAHRSRADASVALLVEPVSCSECSTCPWREVCNVTLLAGSGDASLLPKVGYWPWRSLRDVGIRDRAGVAALDLGTALLVQENVDAERWLQDASDSEPLTAVAELRPRAHKQIAVLEAAGIHTAGDVVEKIHPTTAVLGSFTADAILNARAAIGPEPVYRRPGAAPEVPRADIELDVDMENTNDGVYQWGVYVTDRSGSGLVDEGYQVFITWEPLTPATESEVFTRFWEWMTGVRNRAVASGLTMKAYCWFETAENTQLRRIAAGGAGVATEVQGFIDSDDWVDMLKVFRAGWITGGSTSLKSIAPLAGFHWDVEDPGGGISMLHHAIATDPTHPEAEASRTWLLDYNRGDVEATLAIRAWLEAKGMDLPVVG